MEKKGSEMNEEFLSDGFNVEEYAGKILSSGADLGEQLALLAANGVQLDKQLRKQISAHHEKLLTQATSIESLEDILETLNQHISALKAGSDRATSRTLDLFKKTELRTLQLERLHHTCNLLRDMIRIISLLGKLEKQTGRLTGRDLVKASHMLQELTEITEETDLSGIEILEKDLATLPRLNKEILAKARALLREGLAEQNQTSVSYAVQSFVHLKRLEQEKSRYVSGLLEEIRKEVRDLGRGKEGARPKEIGRSSMGPGGAAVPQAPPSSVLIRASLWNDLQKLVNLLLSIHSQVEVLEMVLSKRKDRQEEEEGENLMESFWQAAADLVRQELSDKSGMVIQTMESEYPKLLQLMSEVLARIRGKAVDSKTESLEAQRKIRMANAFQESLSHLEKSYLSKSLSRLFDSVNLAFSEDGPPNLTELDEIGQVVASEVQVVAFDLRLLEQVCNNLAKTGQHFCDKARDLVEFGKESHEVVGNPSQVQKRNVEVINATFRFRTLLASQIARIQSGDLGVRQQPTIPLQVTAPLPSAIEALTELLVSVMSPLLNSVENAVVAIINTMHDEDFSFALPRDKEAADQQCSMYLRELEGFINRVWDQHLCSIHASDLLYEMSSKVGRKACRLFLIHASLVRPLGEGGRLRLAADFAQMELALSPLCRRLSVDLAPDYLTLRAVRPLLFLSPREIADHSALGTSVPYWLALHLIISQSPEELASPQVSAGWSLPSYSEWLEQHEGERERLNFLRGTLEAYSRSAQSHNKTEYVSTYPIMVDLLKKALEELTPVQ